MTYDSWKTTEPEPDYVPDEEPPEEMDVAPTPLDNFIGAAIRYADLRNLDASIALTLTAPDGSAVTVTKESAARLGRLRE